MRIFLTSSSVIVSPGEHGVHIPLKVGQVLSAKVLETIGDKAFLQLAGNRVPARLETPLPQGSVISLQVKELSPGKIILKLLNPGELSSTELAGILERLSLPASKRNLTLLQLLISAQQELSKENLHQLQQLFTGQEVTPEKAEAATLLLRRGLPLTKENLTLFTLFFKAKPSMAPAFRRGFDPLSQTEAAKKQLVALAHSKLPELLKDSGPELPGAFFAALQVLNSGAHHQSELTPLLTFFLPILINGKIYGAHLETEASPDEESPRARRLHFDLETANLGEVQVDLNVLGDALDCQITVSPEYHRMVQEKVSLLATGVAAEGYKARNITVTSSPSQPRAVVPIDVKV